MIADLKAHLVQFHDLLPGDVMPLAAMESESLGDIEGRPEAVLLQNLRHKVPVRLVAVIKTEYYQLVGNGLEGPGTLICQETQQGKGQGKDG